VAAREYERTHPWLRFELNLERAPAKLWLLLGEARSKCDHIRWVPLEPATAQRLHEIYLAKGVQATTAIEGNTLSEREVLDRLRGQLELPLSKEYLGREIDNIASACTDIFQSALQQGGIRALSCDQILQYNARVLAGLSVAAEVVPGAVRTHSVGVASHRGAPAQDCAYLLQRLCDWLQSPTFDAAEHGLAVPILKAVIAHLYLAWIHPFGDGNGRTARLMEFHLLVGAGVPSPAAHLLSNHYNQTRAEYYRQLDQASKSGGDVVPFTLYAVQGFVDQLKEQLQVIRDQQWHIAWRDYVHEVLGGTTSATLRQRRLMLDLEGTREGGWVALAELRHVSPRIAEAYAGKSEKTVARDVNALRGKQLLISEGGRVRARRELILGFLPPAAQRHSDRPPPPEATTAAER
jgi:Fic family protein